MAAVAFAWPRCCRSRRRPRLTPARWSGRGDAAGVEEVQSANEHQLHEILGELTNTTYFRLFQVD